MFKHTISISCCLEVAVIKFSFFLLPSQAKRKKLDVDLAQVNKTEISFIELFLGDS